MGKIIVACVRTGDAYEVNYVERLRNMVLRHVNPVWDIEFVCYTDQLEIPEGWTRHTIRNQPLAMREGWWGKMSIFSGVAREHPMVYFDLDTVIVGSLDPLFDFAYMNQFGICENFTKAVNPKFPCAFGSCLMTLHPEFGQEIWQSWQDNHRKLKNLAGGYGDQRVIEHLVNEHRLIASSLQKRLPAGYIIGRREFTAELPPEASIMIFAGKTKPHNTHFKWVREHWR